MSAPRGPLPQIPSILPFAASDRRIWLYTRVPTPGPERALVEQFATQIVAALASPVAVFYEPAMTQGYPDLVVVEYVPEVYATWRGQRPYLERQDLRLIAFLHTQTTVDPDTILARHYTQRRPLLRRLVRLAEAGVIEKHAGAWRLLADDALVGIRRILVIEAKMGASQHLIEQALHHCFYANETLLLIPQSRVSPILTPAIERHGLGVWQSTSAGCTCLHPATPREQVMSFETLMLNEWVGRRLIADGFMSVVSAPAVDVTVWLPHLAVPRPLSSYEQLRFGADEGGNEHGWSARTQQGL